MTVFHTHALVEPWHIDYGCDLDEEIARKQANTPVHDLLASGEADDLLVSAAGASGQIAFELSAYEVGRVHERGTPLALLRLWSPGFKPSTHETWKRHRSHQAHGRV